MEDSRPTTVDEYIQAQPPVVQQTLNELRAIIRSEVPQAEERIAYQVPAYKYLYMLVSFGVSKKACSFYVQSPGLVKEMADKLVGQKVSGATIHFTPGEPLPESLIREIVRARMRENEARAAKKG